MTNIQGNMPAVPVSGALQDATGRLAAKVEAAGASSTYAALDLGTNNCRLLVARPAADGFRIVDAFSRIVRLGEGLTRTGKLSEAAIGRTIGALSVCRDKMETRNVTRARLVATEACRSALNGREFLQRVYVSTGLKLEIIDRETEARLAVAGCSVLADPDAESVLIFDIGGGSSEIVWLERDSTSPKDGVMRAWASLPLGVVSLAEKFGGMDVSPETYETIVDFVVCSMKSFLHDTQHLSRSPSFHLLGTSGTVTTIAGVHLNLAKYDRRMVDGLWMSDSEVNIAISRLRNMSYAERAGNACIGPERADLVLAGCAIFEAIRRKFPAQRTRIADRGLREGMLTQMMRKDRVWPEASYAEARP